MASRTLVLLGILFAIILAGIDGTVVGTAMPVAVEDLGGETLYAWAFAAYMLATAVTMPIWGPGSDRWGRRRSFLAGVAVFVVGSLLCGIAPNMPLFIAARAVQGVGAGAIFSVPFIVLAVVYPPERRARALGVVASAWGLSSVAGPLLGTAIVASASWRWVFLVNLPIGIVAAALVLRGMSESFGERRGRFDALGSTLAGVGAAGIIYAFVRLGDGLAGWGEALAIVVGAALLVLFVLHEARVAHPILPLEFFRRRGYSAAMGASFLSAFTAFGLIAFLPLEASRLFPGVPFAVGAVIGTFTVGWSVAALGAGRIVHRFGERVFVVAGMAFLGLGLLALRGALDAPLGTLAAVALLPGVGMGIMTPALTVSVQNSVELMRMGAATGSQQFLRQVGAALGVGSFGLAYHLASFDAGLLVLIVAIGAGLVFGTFLPTTSLTRADQAAAADSP